MAKGLSILNFDCTEGIPPGIDINNEKALGLISLFTERHENLRDAFYSNNFDSNKADELRLFCGDFFWVWTISSPSVLNSLGGEKVLEILENFSLYREITWEISELEYFHQLPERIEIFRGGSRNLENVLKGFSWSLASNVAEMFMDENEGVLVRAEIMKDDILLISTIEAELVPRPDRLIDPQVISSIGGNHQHLGENV